MEAIYFPIDNINLFEVTKRKLSAYCKLEPYKIKLEYPQEQKKYDLMSIMAKQAYEATQHATVISSLLLYNSSNFPGHLTKGVLNALSLEDFLKITSMSKICSIHHLLSYTNGKETKTFEKIYDGTFSQTVSEEKEYQISKLCQIFIPDKHKKTLSEMSEEEMNKVLFDVKNSALSQFAEFLKER